MQKIGMLITKAGHDNLYSVNVYPSTDEFSKLEDGKYYKPTAFVEEFGKN